MRSSIDENEHNSSENNSSTYGSTDGSSDNLKLRIKSTHIDTEIEIHSGPPKTTSVAQLKTLVRRALKQQETDHEASNLNGEDTNRYLRLICKGRLLSPDDSPLSDFMVADNDVVHAVLSKAVSVASKSSTGVATNQFHQGSFHHTNHPSLPQLLQHQRRRRHRPNRGIGTIVGPGGIVTRDPSSSNNNNTDSSSSSDDDQDDINEDENVIDMLERGVERSRRTRRRNERRGFDILRGPLNRQEITAIRTYFSRHVDRYIQQQREEMANNNQSDESDPPATLHLDEPDLLRRRLLIEEEWMRSQGPSSEFRLNLNQNTLLRLNNSSGSSTTEISNSRGTASNGTDREFFWGFCMGFFLGMIALVWIWIPSIPHKQKLGIMSGIICKLVLDGPDGEGSEENRNNEYYNGEDQLIFGQGGGLRGGR